MSQNYLSKLQLPDAVQEVLDANTVIIPETRQQLLELTFQGRSDELEIAYEVPGRGKVIEAIVTRCKNGAAINYIEAYMRRRDPDAMLIADDKPTDKKRFTECFGRKFDSTRDETLAWLKNLGELIVLPFNSGNSEVSYPSLLIAPSNAGFFVMGLADLQGFIPASQIYENYTPQAILFVAPPFRHTHFDGKQVVVHNRLDNCHELFCYNLYPGPSAKKGVYGVLLNIGEKEGWTTLHSSAVRLITPYDNEFVILHEGASGGGKSEMTQSLHRESDARVLVAHNTITHDDFYLVLNDTCELHPVADDMVIAHPPNNGKLSVSDAENGWFLRVDHLDEYGKEPNLEKLCINPPDPLIFLNIDSSPGATALIWEHVMDEAGKPCPNPRVIMPRSYVSNIVRGRVSVDVRSFGVRTPPTTKEQPNYGIIGMIHILPPALSWLWRLVAPRGHANPSIVGSKGLISEGVGSYWPFATGKRVLQANILLSLTLETPKTKHILIPNQYIGAYHVGFKAEWIVREYIARRGSLNFREGQLLHSRCPLLGYTLHSLRVNGQPMPHTLLQVQDQIEVGKEGYDAGAKILTNFFKREIEQYLTSDLDPLGREIINIVMNDGGLEELDKIIPSS